MRCFWRVKSSARQKFRNGGIDVAIFMPEFREGKSGAEQSREGTATRIAVDDTGVHIAFESAVAFAANEHGHVFLFVRPTFGVFGRGENGAMVEQVAIAFGRVFERVQEIGELLHGKAHCFRLFCIRRRLGVIHVMLSVGCSNHPENGARTAIRIKNREGTGETTRERERHEVAHGFVFLGNLFVGSNIGKIARSAGFGALGRGNLQARLNLRNARQVLFEALFVFAAEFALERFDLTSNGIEDIGASFGDERAVRIRIEETVEEGLGRIFGRIDVGFAAGTAIV